jgi:endophilin-B
MVLTQLNRKVPKPNNLENLGMSMVEAGHEIGGEFQYGTVLVKVGEAEKRLGQVEKEFVQKSNDSFLQPLKSFLDGQMKTIQKEKKTLEGKRLDLDACKARLKKLQENPSPKLDVN